MRLRDGLAPALFLAAAIAWTAPAAAGVSFVNVTDKSGIDFTHTFGDGALDSIVETTGAGCGWLDYDGDGWLDAYFVNGVWLDGLSDPKDPRRSERSAATNRLYRNRGDGTFEDVTAKAGVGDGGYGMGLVAGDYDNDGDTDLYVTNYGANVLYRNNGDGTFTDVSKAAGVANEAWGVGASFFDYDNDGDLDLYLGNYVTYDRGYDRFYTPDRFPGPLSYPGQPDVLYRNNGDGTFTDVTKLAKLDLPPGRAMGLSATDLDGDGWTDLFVSNDLTANYVMMNQRDGTFREAALESGLGFGQRGEATSAMGVEFADVDGDGRLDIFVPDPRYSCLYRGLGDGLYEDVTVPSGIAEVVGQYTGWGAILADFDLDGDVDLYHADGDIHHLDSEEDVLFANAGNGRFVDISARSGPWFREKWIARGAAAGDYDNDGDLDVLLLHMNQRAALVRNDTDAGAHWLQVRLRGRKVNRDGVGALVRVTAGGHTQLRVARNGASYLSQHDPRLHFGLGTATSVEAIEVVWPGGKRQKVSGPGIDRVVVVEEAP